MLRVLRVSNVIMQRGLSSSSSNLIFRQASLNAEWQRYKNLYMLEKHEKKNLEDKNKEVMEGFIKTIADLEKADEKLEKVLLPEVARSWIRDFEDKYCPMSELEKIKESVEELAEDERSRELTRRKWLYILEKHPHTNLSRFLAKSEEPISAESFAAKVAKISEICDKLHYLEIKSADSLPEEYDMIDQKLLKDVVRVLSDDNPAMFFKDFRATDYPQISALIKKF